MRRRLSKEFYLNDDPVELARLLLGKELSFTTDKGTCSGIITETEAYAGVNDKASHAYGGRRTGRTEIMYFEGGVSYVYLCYGIHCLFNVVCNQVDIPHAVLIRAIEPLKGTKTMLRNRGLEQARKDWLKGPGKVTSALAIGMDQNGLDLCEGPLGIYEHSGKDGFGVVISERIGVDYAGEDAHLPYRFELKWNR